jgi:hypothetical protein
MSPYLGIAHRRFQKFTEVVVTVLFLVSCLSPLGDGFSVENENVEESIQEKDNVGFDRDTVQQYRLRWRVKGIRHQSRLHHNKRIVHVLLIQDVPELVDVNPGALLNSEGPTYRTLFHPDCC